MLKQYRCIPAGYEDELYDECDDDEDFYCGGAMQMQNLKITIVPDITTGAGINGEDFDSRLNNEYEQFFDSFKMQWNTYKRTPMGDQRLQTVFLQDEEPLKLALKFFAKCPGCNNLKSRNLAQYILETVCELCNSQPKLAAKCDDNLRMVAFNFIKTCGILNLCKAVIETYELRKIRELLLPKLKDLIKEGNYKDAANWAMYLDVTECFGVNDIILPLILQDKLYLVEEYLLATKSLQIPTLKFLDSLLHRKKSVLEMCWHILEEYEYKNCNQSKLNYRAMSKVVTRLLKKLNIEEQMTPNLTFTKACSYLNYLHRRYQSGGMSLESWRELARDAANSKPLQIDLVENIEQHGDLDEAVYWAKYFNVPLDECPKVVRLELEQMRVTTAKVAANSAVDGIVQNIGNTKHQPYQCSDNDFLKLELADENIILVDTKIKFLEMLEYLQVQYIIAFDSEWKPSARNDTYVSLLQLATLERVFLLDCLASEITVHLWKLLGLRIFNNFEILKIGYALHHDLIMLQKSLPLQLNLQTTTCYLDLRDLWNRLKNMKLVVFPYSCSKTSSDGLSSLTEACLGKKLDKSNQCSNWSNRPLRRGQIMYAALDAHCLIQIYQVFTELLARMNLNIDVIVDEITNGKNDYLFNAKRIINETNSKHKNNKKSGNKGRVLKSDKTNEQDMATKCISAAEAKVICDSPLLCVTAGLRSLGIDAVEVTKLDINFYTSLAQRENRYILTTDERQHMFSSVLPTNKIIALTFADPNDAIGMIISSLNITVQQCNYFTRCIRCNGNDFVLATREEMQVMRYGQLQQQKQSKPQQSQQQANAEKQTDLNERTFNLLNVDEHIMKTKQTFAGKAIKLNRIKPSILRTKDTFFICDNCGICTWDGAHKLPTGFY